VRQTPLAALRELEAGAHFDISFQGEKIPTLAEVFENVGHKIFINVELTNYTSPRDNLPEKVCELVQKYGLSDCVLFSSFNPNALIRAHRVLPQVPLGLLTLAGTSGALARSLLGRLIPHQALHPELSDATAALIRRTQRSGRRVHVYTVNQRQDMRRLFSQGVDGIFTDDPLLALQELGQIHPESVLTE
ncbi:MAG: hypothetical protein JW726_08665, partial [Anaerolineales bacterium]|nr:hypothetical protein [Anaerolineales bacterium]